MDLSIIEKVLLTEEEIQERVKELGEEINRTYKGESVTVICILRGAAIFMADLVRHLKFPVEIEFMDVSSYGDGTVSTGEVRILKDLDDSVEGKDLLIVEDIIDTGNTLSYIVNQLKLRGASSVKVCTLLDKPDRRKVDLEVDYCGFVIPDEFIVGYGIDYAQKYRQLPYIGIVKRSVYE